MRNKSAACRILLSFFLLLVVIGCDAEAKPAREVLVFSKTAQFRHHTGIAAGIKAIQQLGQANKFAVDATEDAQVFTPDNLKQYAAVIFLSTTGDVLNETQQQAFEKYIKAGGGFVGIHAAADTEYEWPWYGELNGAYFGSHPPGQQEALFRVVDPNNISTRHLPREWRKTDELYNFKWIAQGLNVLLSIDENSYKGGKNGAYHPMSWYRNFDGGRTFYTGLGHDEKTFADQLFLTHLLGGIEYAMGAKPTAKLKS
ncbi:MAG: ThuA protein [Adhaeribacter sp.]|jgi:type 1 glutamine amidotransferase|nr:ThuA protein [Adhaeribacter sp.]